MSRPDFDARWSALAQRARQAAPDTVAREQSGQLSGLDQLAQLARAREPQALPLVEPRTAWWLAAAAAAVTAVCAPLALEELSPATASDLAVAPALPPPPRLPPPPQLEAPSVYLAMASDAWRELTP